MASFGPHDLTLFSVATPNGMKISIALEELGIPYNMRQIDFGKREQKEPWFLEINPNGKIPALMDSKRNIKLFESGAILLYLADYYDPKHVLLSVDAGERASAIAWAFWQVGGLGPNMGNLHWAHDQDVEIPAALERFQLEVKRLFCTFELGLKDGRPFLAGKAYSLADICSFGWIKRALGPESIADFGFNLQTDFPLTYKWLLRVARRPAVQKGVHIPNENPSFLPLFQLAASTTD